MKWKLGLGLCCFTERIPSVRWNFSMNCEHWIFLVKFLDNTVDLFIYFLNRFRSCLMKVGWLQILNFVGCFFFLVIMQKECSKKEIMESGKSEANGLLEILPPVDFCCIYGSTLHPNNADEVFLLSFFIYFLIMQKKLYNLGHTCIIVFSSFSFWFLQ